MTNSDKWQDNLRKSYDEKSELYKKFCGELKKQLQELLFQANVADAFPIESRVKSWESIYNKYEHRKLKPKSLDDISDLAGFRIVLLFKSDLNKTYKIIEKEFKILKKEDATQRLADDKFGYGSVHYDVHPPSSWFSAPTLSTLKGLKAEIQVRTASQHIWAAASHLLQYKREKDIPVPIRRSINRTAALLELVDLEFERVLSERDKYIQQQKEIPKDEPLNIDLLRITLEELLPKENKDRHEDYHELLEDLRYFKIETKSKLEEIIKKNWGEVKEEEKSWLKAARKELSIDGHVFGTSEERTTRGVFFTYVGLTRQALKEEVGEDKWKNYWRRSKLEKEKND